MHVLPQLNREHPALIRPPVGFRRNGVPATPPHPNNTWTCAYYSGQQAARRRGPAQGPDSSQGVRGTPVLPGENCPFMTPIRCAVDWCDVPTQ